MSVMNSRRLILCPQTEDHSLAYRLAHAALCPAAKLAAQCRSWVINFLTMEALSK
jgi:hypothetical protein